MRNSHTGAFENSSMLQKSTLDFRRTNTMTRYIDYIIDTPSDPVVTILYQEWLDVIPTRAEHLVTSSTITSQVEILLSRFPIDIFVSPMRTINSSCHSRCWLCRTCQRSMVGDKYDLHHEQQTARLHHHPLTLRLPQRELLGQHHRQGASQHQVF